MENRTLKASPIEIFVVPALRPTTPAAWAQQRNQPDGPLNLNSAQQNEARRLAFKPNGLGQRTGTGADGTGKLVGTEKARAPRLMTKVDQNEATKMLLTTCRAEVNT